MRGYLLSAAAWAAGTGLCHVLFGMPVWGCAAWLIAGLALMPLARGADRRQKRERGDYYDVTGYMEQLLCSYKRWGTLTKALSDCQLLYEENTPMRKEVDRVLGALKGEGEGNAFAGMEKRYPGRRLRMLHRFLEEAEKMGGDCRETLDILLKDLYMWKRRVLSYQKKKQYIRQECRLSVLMAAGLCYLSRWIIPVDLVRSGRILWAYQCSAVTAGLIFIGLDVWMRRRLSGPWNSEKEILSERESQSVTRQYERLQRGKRALFARKICGSEVSREFPYWILTVTLYLQQDSVYQAIIHATGQFQGVMEQEIRKLLRGIYEDPLSIQPYHDFFRALDLPDVKTGMKLLYAISQNGPQDAGRQIYFLVDQNMEMMDQSEQKQFDKQLAGFEFLKQIPMAAAGIKIVADMLIFLMAFMGSAAGGL